MILPYPESMEERGTDVHGFELQPFAVELGDSVPSHSKLKDFSTKWWSRLADNVGEVRMALKEQMPGAHLRPLLWKMYFEYTDFVVEKLDPGRGNAQFTAANLGCSYLQEAFMWMGGWRPTSAIILAYSTLGSDSAAPHKLSSELDALQKRTQQVEDSISSRVADLQMLNSDDVISNLVSGSDKVLVDADVRELEAAVESRLKTAVDLLIEAEQLRLCTLKGLLDTITPHQAARWMVAAYEILFCLALLSSEQDVRFAHKISGRQLSGP